MLSIFYKILFWTVNALALFHLIEVGYYVSKQFFKCETTPLRPVDCFDLEFYTTENGLSFINGVAYPHRIGNILLAAPGSNRYSKKSFECYFIKFMPTFPTDEIEALSLAPLVYKAFNYQWFSGLFSECVQEFSYHSAGWETMISGKLTQILAGILREQKLYTGGSLKVYADNIYAAEEFMKKHLKEELTLADIARSAALSPSFFHKTFKELTGQTPWRFLQMERLKLARHLVLNSRLSLDKIADLCGFCSRQYFDTVFKKEFHQTPACLRKSVKRII